METSKAPPPSQTVPSVEEWKCALREGEGGGGLGILFLDKDSLLLKAFFLFSFFREQWEDRQTEKSVPPSILSFLFPLALARTIAGIEQWPIYRAEHRKGFFCWVTTLTHKFNWVKIVFNHLTFTFCQVKSFSPHFRTGNGEVEKGIKVFKRKRGKGGGGHSPFLHSNYTGDPPIPPSSSSYFWESVRWALGSKGGSVVYLL